MSHTRAVLVERRLRRLLAAPPRHPCSESRPCGSTRPARRRGLPRVRPLAQGALAGRRSGRRHLFSAAARARAYGPGADFRSTPPGSTATSSSGRASPPPPRGAGRRGRTTTTACFVCWASSGRSAPPLRAWRSRGPLRLALLAAARPGRRRPRPPRQLRGLLHRADRRAAAGAVGAANSGDPAVLRRRARSDLACAPTSKEAQLTPPLRDAATKDVAPRPAIRGLLALEKSGADLPEPDRARIRGRVRGARRRRRRPIRRPRGKRTQIFANQMSCGKLASVGAAAPRGGRPGRSSGSPGRPGRPVGGRPGAERRPPKRR